MNRAVRTDARSLGCQQCGVRFVLAACIIGSSVSGCARAPVRLESTEPRAESGSWEERPSGIAVGPLDPTRPFNGSWFPRERLHPDTFDRATEAGTALTRRTLTQQASGGSVLRVDELESGETIVRTDLRSADDGSWSIVRSLASGIESVFDPPALFLPASAPPDEPIVVPFEVTSTGRGIPDNPGAGTATVVPLGSQRVRTPAGVFDAYALAIELRFEIGPARIAFDQRIWIDTGPSRTGVVAAEQHDRVRVFGITFLNARTVSVLRETGGNQQ